MMQSEAGGPMRRVGGIALWVLIGLETLAMGAAGAAKFLNWPLWSGMFEAWGYGAWFAAVIGAAEVVGALLLLVPKLSTYAASGLAVIMAGALFTTLTKPNELGWQAAAVHLVILLAIAGFRYGRRARREN